MKRWIHDAESDLYDRNGYTDAMKRRETAANTERGQTISLNLQQVADDIQTKFEEIGLKCVVEDRPDLNPFKIHLAPFGDYWDVLDAFGLDYDEIKDTVERYYKSNGKRSAQSCCKHFERIIKKNILQLLSNVINELPEGIVVDIYPELSFYEYIPSFGNNPQKEFTIRPDVNIYVDGKGLQKIMYRK